jgi:hypothetical protein
MKLVKRIQKDYIKTFEEFFEKLNLMLCEKQII